MSYFNVLRYSLQFQYTFGQYEEKFTNKFLRKVSKPNPQTFNES